MIVFNKFEGGTVLEVAELFFLYFPYIYLYDFFPRTTSRRLSTLQNL